MTKTLSERMTALERDLAHLKRALQDSMSDPEATPAGRLFKSQQADIARRLRLVEIEMRGLVRWASGAGR